MTITVYGADWCRDCVRTKRHLEQLGVDFVYLDVAADNAIAVEAERISGCKHIPVVVYPDGTHQVEPTNAQVDEKLAALSE